METDIVFVLAEEVGFTCRKHGRSLYIWSKENANTAGPARYFPNPCYEIPFVYELVVSLTGAQLAIHRIDNVIDLNDPTCVAKLKEMFSDLVRLARLLNHGPYVK